MTTRRLGVAIPLALAAAALSAACLTWTGSASTGPFAGTHAGLTLNGGVEIYRKDAGFHPVEIRDSPGPNFGQLSDKFDSCWGSHAGSMNVAAISLGIDAINEELAGEIVDRHGDLRPCVVAHVAEGGWAALQFTVESDTSALTGSHVAALRDEGADAPMAIFCYVFPGSSLELDDSGAPSTVDPGITRSLSRTELGIDEPISALNTQLALYLLSDPDIGSTLVPHGLETEPTVYFTLSASVGTYDTNTIYRTTWHECALSWSDPSPYATLADLGLADTFSVDGTSVPVVIDGLAIDTVGNDPKLLLSTNWPGAPSELMFWKGEVPSPPPPPPPPPPPSCPPPPPPPPTWGGTGYIFGSKGVSGEVKTLDTEFDGAPVGDVCYRDPFSTQGGNQLLDHYLVSSRHAVPHAKLPFYKTARMKAISASGFRTIDHDGRPAAAFVATWARPASPKQATLLWWSEQRASAKDPWVRTTRPTEHSISTLTGPRAGVIVSFPDSASTALSRNRRLVGRWSFRIHAARYSSKIVALHY